MPTIPTGKVERGLRAMYLKWLAGLDPDGTDASQKVDEFHVASQAFIEREGGRVAMLGALAGFPAPKLLDLNPHIGTIYDDMKQAAIQAGIAAGLNATDVARQMFRAGMDKSFYRLNRLARTETVQAYWKNAWDSIEGLPGIVMVWGSEDGPRTCDWCRERDGMVMESSSLRDHPNGRCTPVPTLRRLVEYRGSVDASGRIYLDEAWAGGSSVAPGWKPAMTESAAQEWAEGSVFQEEFLHGTSPTSATSIRSDGFRLDTDQEFGRMHGDGVYLTQNQRTADMYSQGEVLRVRVNVTNPVELNDIYTDPDFFEISDWVEAKFPGYTDQQLNREILNEFVKRKNYDAIIKRGRDGSIDELIVVDPRNVVVVG